MNAPARLRVGVIGAGRVGAVIGAALREVGHDLVGVSVRSNTTLTELFLPGVPVLGTDEVVRRAELVLVAVPDDAIAEVVAGLDLHPEQVVAHFSGRHGLAVLAGVARPMALHPVFPFTGGPADLVGISWGVTANDPLADDLVRQLGGVPVHVTEERRPLWHAALAHGANHLVTLVASAADMLRAAGAEDPGTVLRPLLTAALDGALELGDAALTGPVKRGDAGTVAAHLEVVPDRELYLALARATARRAGTGDVMAGVL
ncbi:MAG: hypothetical protein JWO22_3532 [Frankiales bacterium]|nr:hypothetical protein [Frankiales bacterium]